MNPDVLTVRQWQKLYQAGTFAADDCDARELAGWSNFSDPLTDRRVHSLSKLVLGITHPFILDNYRVFFSDGQPNAGPKYGGVCFYPLDKERFQCLFGVDLDYPYAREKWSLFTRRYGEGEYEFECGHIRRMIRYIHTMAGELEHNIKPAFWPEMKAARQFVFERLPDCGHLVLRREGEHSYSTWQRDTDRRVFLHVAHRPEDAPPGFQAGDAAPMCGLYVFARKDAEKAAEITNISRKKSHKKKSEVER